MNKFKKKFKFFSISQDDRKQIQLAQQWLRNYFDLVFPIVKAVCTVLALIIVLTFQDELNAKLVGNNSLFVMSWLLLSFSLVWVANHLITRWLGASTETAHTPELANLPDPDQLPYYLALKERILAELEDDFWWDSVADKLSDDSIHIDLKLARPLHNKVMAWAEMVGVSFEAAAEWLLVSGLVDDELDKITKEMGWKAKEQIDGGVPWM